MDKNPSNDFRLIHRFDATGEQDLDRRSHLIGSRTNQAERLHRLKDGNVAEFGLVFFAFFVGDDGAPPRRA